MHVFWKDGWELGKRLRHGRPAAKFASYRTSESKELVQVEFGSQRGQGPGCQIFCSHCLCFRERTSTTHSPDSSVVGAELQLTPAPIPPRYLPGTPSLGFGRRCRFPRGWGGGVHIHTRLFWSLSQGCAGWRFPALGAGSWRPGPVAGGVVPLKRSCRCVERRSASL